MLVNCQQSTWLLTKSLKFKVNFFPSILIVTFGRLIWIIGNDKLMNENHELLKLNLMNQPEHRLCLSLSESGINS